MNSRAATFATSASAAARKSGSVWKRLGAEVTILEADHAGADDAEALRDLGEVERADVVDDALAVELRERQLDRIRTGRENHVLAGQLDLAAVVLLHLDDLARVQRAEAVIRRHLVGLEQRRDAAGELLHDLVLAPDHRADVDLRVLRRDAVLAEQVMQVVPLARAVEQRLRRNAADAQARAAERRLAVLAERGVDAGRLQAQLRGADGRVVAGGAGADDDYVELL